MDKHAFPSVHRGIVRAAMLLLEYSEHPTAAFYTVSDAETLVEETEKPDQIGDRMQGRGLHYYCAVSPIGESIEKNSAGFYPNANGKYGVSPCTMLHGEYRSAIMLSAAGKQDAAMRHLARAAHMLSDICCPPHVCGLTYFSKFAAQHKRYELTAAKLFWMEQPVTEEYTASQRFAKLAEGEIPMQNFLDAFSIHPAALAGDTAEHPLTAFVNQIAVDSAKEREYVLGDDLEALEQSIMRRILAAIRYTAGLFAAFAVSAQQIEGDLLHEGCPYYVCGLPDGDVLLDEPLFVQFLEDGAFSLVSQDERSLTVGPLSSVRFVQPHESKNARFRLGYESFPVLYLDGDRNRVLGTKNGHLHCYDRRFCSLPEDIFQMRTAIFLRDTLPYDE